MTRKQLEDLALSAQKKIEDEKVEEIVSRQEDASLRSPGVPAHYYRFFYALTKELKPDLVLELGTHTGISALCLASGCSEAKIITVDHNSYLLEECKRTNIEYRLHDSLQKIDLKDKIDILFIDTNHDGKRPLEEYKLYIENVKEGGLIFFDDVYLFDCMKKFWEEFNPDYIKFDLPVHGGAGFGVIIKEAQDA